MDVIIKVTVSHVSFLVSILLGLPERLSMKEKDLFFNYTALDVNVRIHGKAMYWCVVKDVPRHFIKTAVQPAAN